MHVEVFDGLTDEEISAKFGDLRNFVQLTAENSFPLLIDELVTNHIFSSKTEARNMIKNKGIALFCYEGIGPQFKIEGQNYKTIDGQTIENFNDKHAILSDINVHWKLIAGDVIKIGKRRFIKIVE